MASSAIASRPRQTVLQSLAIDHDARNQTSFSRNSVSTPRKLSSTLPSPSLLTAREFYRDRAILGISRVDDHHPRRHSVMATPGSLTSRMSNIKITSPGLKLPEKPERAVAQNKSIEDGQQEVVPSKVEQNALVGVGTLAGRRQSSDASGSAARILGPIPFQYAHDRLRTWGNTYLGNAATADAFVHAVYHRRPSFVREGTSGDNGNEFSKYTTVRARVIPKDKERKPFLIQKQFDVEDLRSGIPPVQQQYSSYGIHGTSTLRRSSRVRQSINGSSRIQDQRRASTGNTLARDAIPFETGAVPIHVEYALHYLPVLAALMLSGHIRKGDSIDLPLPYPQAWHAVISYVYTGEGLVTVAVKENILFLAGRID